MNPYNLSILCFGFCSLLLGILVWLKRQDGIGNRYLGLSLCYAGWAFFISINLSNNVSPDIGLLMGRLGNGFALFIPPFWYHFIVSFIGNLPRRRIYVKFFFSMAIIIACFTFSPWFISEVRAMVGFSHYSKAGPVFGFYALFFFSVVLLSFLELFRKIQSTEGSEKKQMQGLFWTALVGYIGGCPTFFPIFGIAIPQYALLLLPFYPFGLTYVMIRQGLFDVEELAQAAHRDKLTAIGVLAASINHEVRNPLFIIKGLAESWIERQKEGVLQDKDQIIELGKDSMRRSVEQADRAMDIIKRLSLFAKAGIEGEMKFEEVSIPEVFENVLPLVRYELATHGITLTREIPKDLPTIKADKRYLEEIFFNLIVNAIQALKDAGKTGEIKITAKAGDLGLGTRSLSFSNSRGTSPEERVPVVITIKDTGPGISEDKLKDVFRPFYTTKAEGTGLGLYITKQLVEKIRGRVEVSSKAGLGTTFMLTLSGL